MQVFRFLVSQACRQQNWQNQLLQKNFIFFFLWFQIGQLQPSFQFLIGPYQMQNVTSILQHTKFSYQVSYSAALIGSLSKFYDPAGNILINSFTQFSSVQSLSHKQLFVTPWTAARQASLSITNSRNLLKLKSIKLVMPSKHFILCRPLLLPLSIFPSIRVFSIESTLHIRWPKYWSFSFSINLSIAQTQVHLTGDAIQTLHPLLAPSPPAFNLSQHQGLFH